MYEYRDILIHDLFVHFDVYWSCRTYCHLPINAPEPSEWPRPDMVLVGAWLYAATYIDKRAWQLDMNSIMHVTASSKLAHFILNHCVCVVCALTITLR